MQANCDCRGAPPGCVPGERLVNKWRTRGGGPVCSTLTPCGFRPADPAETDADEELVVAAERGRRLIEESREFVLVLDADDRVVVASQRAREALEGIVEGAP